MRPYLQRTALTIAVAWFSSGGGPSAQLSVDVAPADLIGPGRAAQPSEGRIDQPPGATASALLIRNGQSTVRELRAAQRDRSRDLGLALVSVSATFLPATVDGARGHLRVTAYPAPLCPHPRCSRGPPRAAASTN